jgi:hypothetical protein
LKRLAAIALIVAIGACTGPGAASSSGSTVDTPATSPTIADTAPAATDTPGPASPAAATAEDVDGPFRLTFTLPRTTWFADEAIQGEAVLALVDGDLAELGAASNGPIEFSFKEVDGARQMGPAWDTACASARLAADSPIVRSIRKSGGYSDDQPDAAFYRAFFADPLVRLPAGDWDITAMAEFMDDRDCTIAHQVSMSATVRVHITG